MSLPYFNANVNNISALADQPNDADGLSSTEMKAKFDKAASDIKTYLNNTLIPAIEALLPTIEMDTFPANASGFTIQLTNSDITDTSVIFVLPACGYEEAFTDAGIRLGNVSISGTSCTINIYAATAEPSADVKFNLVIYK